MRRRRNELEYPTGPGETTTYAEAQEPAALRIDNSLGMLTVSACAHGVRANIQGCDPGDDRLFVLRFLQHGFLLSVITSNRKWLPAGAAGTVTNLVRVLEATLKGPKRSSPCPTDM